VLPAKRMAMMPVRGTGGEFKHGWSSRLIAGQMTGTLADAPHMAEMLEAALAGLRAVVGDELCGLPVMVVPESAAGPVGEQGVASGSAKKRSVGRRRTVINKVGREREVCLAECVPRDGLRLRFMTCSSCVLMQRSSR
jgi:hypothetical protein